MKWRLLVLAMLGLMAVAYAQQPQTSVPHFGNPIRYTAVAGAQYALAITSNTALTVPSAAVCAQISVEGNQVRRTSDGTTATTTVGTLMGQGASWTDCGPLAAYRFTAVAGSPVLNVEYFR
jgi:hypothetical protein